MKCRHCGKPIYEAQPYGWWVHGSADDPRMITCAEDGVLHAAELADHLWIKDGQCLRSGEDNPFTESPSSANRAEGRQG